jgi:hypothetical protein
MKSVSGDRGRELSEMGIGKGGKIIQKIYPDPYGLEVWKEQPMVTKAIYVVNAMAFEEITGIKIPAPIGHENYAGHWFGLEGRDRELDFANGPARTAELAGVAAKPSTIFLVSKTKNEGRCTIGFSFRRADARRVDYKEKFC